jgi:hypothetical protein
MRSYLSSGAKVETGTKRRRAAKERVPKTARRQEETALRAIRAVSGAVNRTEGAVIEASTPPEPPRAKLPRLVAES